MMKYLPIAVALVMLLFGILFACPADSVPFSGGCAALPRPADQGVAVLPSDEVAPKDKMPSWQRDGIKADMPSVSIEDAIKDQADVEGKKAAGVK